ncbi:cell division protein FtsL [Candidatus Desantisbacteria bacterium]|nr:cell division protein FtsL [Candidatus Desantisbacteria bacterium]
MKPIYQKKFMQAYAAEKNAISFQSMFFYLIIILTSLAIILSYVGLKVKLTHLGFEIESMEKIEKEYIKKNQQLKLKREMLLSLERIEKVAKDNLGMQVPDKVKIIPVKKE